ncbi:MAG: 2Fe-2S iron-sulfur cluster-binding protein, partial [Spirochaetota bacterium]
MSNETKLVIIDEKGSVEFLASPGNNLLETLRSLDGLAEPSHQGGARPESPCGGKGRCGKCRVRAAGDLSPPDDQEMALLSSAEFDEGWRLACLARIAPP